MILHNIFFLNNIERKINFNIHVLSKLSFDKRRLPRANVTRKFDIFWLKLVFFVFSIVCQRSGYSMTLMLIFTHLFSSKILTLFVWGFFCSVCFFKFFFFFSFCCCCCCCCFSQDFLVKHAFKGNLLFSRPCESAKKFNVNVSKIILNEYHY